MSDLNKFTPGPWIIKNEKGETWEVNRLIGSREESLGDVYLSCRDGEDEQYAANAHLIAASPDLLEALDMLIKHLDVAGVPEMLATGKARAAIAKARGQS